MSALFNRFREGDAPATQAYAATSRLANGETMKFLKTSMLLSALNFAATCTLAKEAGKPLDWGIVTVLLEVSIPATLIPTAGVISAIWQHKCKPSFHAGATVSVLPAFILATVLSAQGVSDVLNPYGHPSQGTLALFSLFCVAFAALLGSLVRLALAVCSPKTTVLR